MWRAEMKDVKLMDYLAKIQKETNVPIPSSLLEQLERKQLLPANRRQIS